MPTSVFRALAITALAVGPLTAAALAVPSGAAPLTPAARDDIEPTWFERTATYPVFQNVPAGVDPADPTVAEISAVSADGRTVAYSDALGGRIGFLDITDAYHPVGLGTHDVTGGSPTSVSIVDGFALVVVDESTYPGTERAGRLDVVSLAGGHAVVESIDLGGQPDSIAISPDGSFAAIAMENQRDEDADLPQAPAGFVQVIDIDNPDPATWTPTPVALTAADLAGLDTPEDAEPEYVDINEDNQLAVTLQENNGVAVIDLATAAVETVWSAGNAVVEDVDTTDDGIFNATDTIDLPREPDAVQWVGDGLVATANEGDWKGGTRGWTVFDAATGAVEWDAGNSFENIAIEHGLFNDGRADNKGSEAEGLAFEVFHDTPFAFVGSERSNFVAVYDMTDPTDPDFIQALPATNGPEGLLPIPSRDLLVVSSEEDDASVLVRSSVGVYALGTRTIGYRLGIKGPSFPSIASVSDAGVPIGWGALGALSAAPGDPTHVWAAGDAAYATGRIYSVDVTGRPALIEDVIEVTEGGEKPAIDIEGLFARPAGGFWVAQEGANGPGNQLLRLNAGGGVAERVDLPTEVTDHVRNWGLEGVTAVGRGGTEQVYVAMQRPLWVDPSVGASAVVPLEGNVARIGRYTPATGDWEWFTYPLGTTTVPGDWIGLSEITAVDSNTLAVIERDKQNGTTAAVKRVYLLDVPTSTSAEVRSVRKRLAIDVLPYLQKKNGWTQEKLEGLTIVAGGGEVLSVTDNDGVDDATGETVLCHLGTRLEVFGHDTRTRVRAPARVDRGDPVPVRITVTRAEGGRVALMRNGRRIAVVKVDRDGVMVERVRGLKPGRHTFRARYVGSGLARPSTSKAITVTVRR